MSRIIRLKAENIMRLVAFEYEPKENVIKITGKNGAGKTAVLDLMTMAFGGKKACPKMPIREGQDKGYVLAETEDYIVRRVFTEKDSYFEVHRQAGGKIKSPQALMDKLFGDIAADPLAWVRGDRTAAERRSQRATLLKLIGVDLDAMDEELQGYKDRAQICRREIDTVRPKASQFDATLPSEVPDLGDLVEQYQLAQENNSNIKGWEREMADIDAEMERIKAQLSSWNQRRNEVRAFLKKTQPADVEGLKERMDKAAQEQQRINNNNEYREAMKRLKALSEKLTAAVKGSEDVERRKHEALRAAKFPVKGLSVDDEGVVFEGLPLSQVNHAKQVEIGMAVQMSLKPDLKVMRIDGNGLGSEAMAAIQALANKHDFQVWMEIADETEQIGVVISEGRIKRVNGADVTDNLFPEADAMVDAPKRRKKTAKKRKST